MTTDRDDALDDLFAAARGAEDWEMSEALTARIMADAAAEMPRPAAAPVRRGPWAALVAALGGWPAVSGLAAATVAGVWLGAAPPPALDSFLSGSAVPVSFSAGIDVLEAEG